MEAAYSNSCSSSKSAYLSQNVKPEESAKVTKHAYPLQPRNSLLHSVRKSSSQAKPWKRLPVAPMPPTRVKVYKVDHMNFRELVQQLTGAPEFKPQPQMTHDHHQFLQSVTATSSLDVVTSLPNPILSSRDNNLSSTTGLVGSNLSSPSSSNYNWCSFLPMSPGTITSLEPARVL